MNFGKMVKELLSGKTMRQVDWLDNFYIKIGEDDSTVDEMGFPYAFKESDYKSKWEVYEHKIEKSEAGTLLYHVDSKGDKKYCRVIIDGDRYDIIDTSNWSISVRNIGKNSLREAMYEFGLEKESTTGKNKQHEILFSDKEFE